MEDSSISRSYRGGGKKLYFFDFIYLKDDVLSQRETCMNVRLSVADCSKTCQIKYWFLLRNGTQVRILAEDIFSSVNFLEYGRR